jgi:CheY-like chemotaxis protein
LPEETVGRYRKSAQECRLQAERSIERQDKDRWIRLAESWDRQARKQEGACRKVLIAEDDLMIADMCEEVLVKNGYRVCGIARTVDQAVTLGRRHRPDLALLDMRLAEGGLGTEIAAQLCPLGKLGVLYVTGNSHEVMLTATDGDACLDKPYRWADLLLSLEIVIGIGATGRAAPPFPHGFRLLTPAPTVGRESACDNGNYQTLNHR